MNREQYILGIATRIAAQLFDELTEYDASLVYDDGTLEYWLVDIQRAVAACRKPRCPVTIKGSILLLEVPLPIDVYYSKGCIHIQKFSLPVDCLERTIANLVYLQTLFPEAIEEYEANMAKWPFERDRQEMVNDIVKSTVKNAVESLLSSAGLEGGISLGRDCALVKVRKIVGRYKRFTIWYDSYIEGMNEVQKWLDRYVELAKKSK